MNSPPDEGDRPVDADEQLDAVLEVLRNQRVPPIPTTEFAKRVSTSAGISSGRYAVAVGVALAASVILWIVLHFRALPPVQNDSAGGRSIAETTAVSSPIIELANVLGEPLDDLTVKLDQLEQDLDELEISASLLDVRNEADRLVADFAPLKDTL